jgi:hypothetical protein
VLAVDVARGRGLTAPQCSLFCRCDSAGRGSDTTAGARLPLPHSIRVVCLRLASRVNSRIAVPAEISRRRRDLPAMTVPPPPFPPPRHHRQNAPALVSELKSSSSASPHIGGPERMNSQTG